MLIRALELANSCYMDPPSWPRLHAAEDNHAKAKTPSDPTKEM
jgi:hypothetical protein